MMTFTKVENNCLTAKFQTKISVEQAENLISLF